MSGLSPLAVLLQLSDSALPTGAFSHSFGLEQYISRGEVDGEESFAQWLRAYTASQLTTMDALLVSLRYRGEDEAVLAELALAATLPAQVRAAGLAMAKRLRAIGRDALGVPEASEELAHPALEFARIARHVGVGAETAMTAHVTTAVISIVQNAVRGIPIGQSAGQRVIARAHPWVAESVRRAGEMELADLGAVAPGLDTAQMQHERLRARMFMS